MPHGGAYVSQHSGGKSKQVELREFKAILVYTASSWLDSVKQRTVSIKIGKKNMKLGRWGGSGKEKHMTKMYYMKKIN